MNKAVDVSRLPKWAQNHIRSLERERGLPLDALQDLLTAWEREFISFFGEHARADFAAVPEVVKARAVLAQEQSR